jgi:hypothetical protein
MWLNESEFEEAVATYWENEDQQDVIHLRLLQDFQTNRVFSTRAKARSIFQRIQEGLSGGHSGRAGRVLH